jgi:hypothetical protein
MNQSNLSLDCGMFYTSGSTRGFKSPLVSGDTYCTSYVCSRRVLLSKISSPFLSFVVRIRSVCFLSPSLTLS